MALVVVIGNVCADVGSTNGWHDASRSWQVRRAKCLSATLQ